MEEEMMVPVRQVETKMGFQGMILVPLLLMSQKLSSCLAAVKNSRYKIYSSPDWSSITHLSRIKNKYSMVNKCLLI
jgi:hypothetical protein